MSAFFLKCLDVVFGFYKIVISPLLGTNCRFTPTCSEYVKESIKVHGWFNGIILGIRRLSRCQPWGGSGYDPVPGTEMPKSENCCNKK